MSRASRRLTEYVRRFTCPYCGRAFPDERSLKIHISRKHHLVKYPKEGVYIYSVDPNYAVIEVKLKKSLLNDLAATAEDLGIPLDELIFRGLVALAVEPGVYQEFRDYLLKKRKKATANAAI